MPDWMPVVVAGPPNVSAPVPDGQSFVVVAAVVGLYALKVTLVAAPLRV